MKTRIKNIAIFVLFGIAINATSQQITYSGPIEYKFLRTKTAKGMGSKAYNWNVDINEKNIIEGTFYVVFTGVVSPAGVTVYQMTSIQEDIYFENSINNKASEERISQVCSDDRMKSTRTVSPGDSRIYKQTVKHERLDPNKPCISRGTMTITSPNSPGKKELPSGNYSIMLGGVIETNMTSEVYSEQKFACNPDRNVLPDILSQTFKMPIPVSIVFEEDFDGSDVLTGRQTFLDNHSTDCGPGSPYANFSHGNVDCAFDESITVSWTLIKRTTECDANLSSIKGNVKINGVPVENGSIKIGAGDMISTGGKSRIKIDMPDGSYMAVGSNSRLILGDPCNLAPPTEISDKHKRNYIWAVTGRMAAALYPYRVFRVVTGSAGGIRGQIVPTFKEHHAHNDNSFDIRGGPSYNLLNEVIEVDPEKESIIKEMGDLRGNRIAFYIHSDSEGIYDVSAIKGDLKVESAIRSVQMLVKKGSTATSWPDGSPLVDIYVRISKN